ncbi:MAG: DNA polymerase III subunit chi [Casimicrobiaceae bacterium]|nr:DNA polymerase III subunit chi [Casimicrobiaceae bacterium]MDW8311950.1 DNA polymerase III subunit chi [Burkholderiales bacterium]
MTAVHFLTDVREPLLAAYAEVAAAYARGERVRVVTADEAMTQRFDRLLWERERESFLPHVRLDSPLAAATPIIVDHCPEHSGIGDLLVNLALQVPPFFASFRRVVEIVGSLPEVVAAARERWRFYRAQGVELSHARGA